MTTLKEFEDALREQGNEAALSILDRLRARDKANRALAPVRRVTGRKMTPELAHSILELHRSTKMTQQEIAFRLGVNQGRVNEVVKRGKWLTDNPTSPEAKARDKAMVRVRKTPTAQKRERATTTAPTPVTKPTRPDQQLGFDGF